MKVTFKNLGPIEKANLELGDLTIIAGRNNTGKTYIAHALYGFLKRIPEITLNGGATDSFFESHFEETTSFEIDSVISQFIRSGKYEWPIDSEMFASAQKRFMQAIEYDYSSRFIFDVVAIQESKSKPVSLEVDLDNSLFPSRLTNDFSKNRKMVFEYSGGVMEVSLSGGSGIDISDEEDPLLYHDIIRNTFLLTYGAILTWQLNDEKFRPFILPSSRHSAPLFYKEVDYVNNQAVRGRPSAQSLFHSRRLEQGIASVVQGFISQHYLPILDNVNFNRDMSRIAERHENTPVGDTSSDIEVMLGGSFHSRDSQIRFISSGGVQFDIPLSSASSSVWELSQLYFFLSYVLDSGNLRFLIIDEPESHLDTANQILFARLLVRLVNSGVRVLITTHSDYIIREINNLIMLSSSLEAKERVREKFGYRPGDQLCLSQVSAYVAENGGLTPCKKDEYGIEVKSLDDVIVRLNETSEELATKIEKREEE